MKTKKYHLNGVEISKRQQAFVNFLEKGTNDFVQAYRETERKITSMDVRFYASWFNRTLKCFHRKGLLFEIPFVYRMGNGWVWSNPGIKGNKSNFEAFTSHQAQMELKAEINKII